MRQLKSLFVSFAASAALLAQSSFAQALNPVVRFQTNLGDIDVTLTPNVAPLTVANFLKYVNSGTYANSIIHRSVPGFIIQGGGYQIINHVLTAAPQNTAVVNEFNVSNTRGTIAMAKLGNDPNSATNQWFFNLANNGSNLDAQNGGFTVFGNVLNSASLAVMDRIAALPVYNQGSPFDQIPLYNFRGTGVAESNYVLVNNVFLVPLSSSTGFQSAASYAVSGAAGVSPGEILTLFGTGLGPANLAGLTLDSNNVVTTSVGGTRVLFDGTPAPMIYSLNGQISTIAPYNLASKTITRVVVEYQGVQGAAVQLPVVPANPGIFTLNASGKGDGAIVRLDGSIVSATSPAAPGDILILYGAGQGATSPQLGDGVIVGSTLPIPTLATSLLIDGQSVTPLYSGGAPTLVNGVLQINFQVPQLSAGSHSIQIQVGQRQSPTGVTLQTK